MVPQHLPSFHCVGVLEPKEPTCTLVFKALLTEQIIGQERKGHAKKKKKIERHAQKTQLKERG